MGDMTNLLQIIGLVVVALIAVVIVGFFIAFGKLWLQAYSSGIPVAVAQFIGMFLRKVNPQLIVNVLVTSHKAGMKIGIDKGFADAVRQTLLTAAGFLLIGFLVAMRLPRDKKPKQATAP